MMNTNEKMHLGDISIFSPRGVEFQDYVIEVTTVERDHDRLKQDRYLLSYDLDNTGNEVELNEPIPNIPIHPLDIEISGDYITGSYKDAGIGSPPYEVKLWLVVEEKPEPLKND
ncbi:MAG: hypothetical protein AAGG59_01675 [Bacteroidota bacterium]